MTDKQKDDNKVTYSIVLDQRNVEYVDKIAPGYNQTAPRLSRSSMINHILDLLRRGIIKLP